jgi:cation transport regulator ChaC
MEQTMTIQPEGEDLRKAVKWISDERQEGSNRSPAQLAAEASLKFNLSPADADYLARFVQKNDE